MNFYSLGRLAGIIERVIQRKGIFVRCVTSALGDESENRGNPLYLVTHAHTDVYSREIVIEIAGWNEARTIHICECEFAHSSVSGNTRVWEMLDRSFRKVKNLDRGYLYGLWNNYDRLSCYSNMFSDNPSIENIPNSSELLLFFLLIDFRLSLREWIHHRVFFLVWCNNNAN